MRKEASVSLDSLLSVNKTAESHLPHTTGHQSPQHPTVWASAEPGAAAAAQPSSFAVGGYNSGAFRNF